MIRWSWTTAWILQDERTNIGAGWTMTAALICGADLALLACGFFTVRVSHLGAFSGAWAFWANVLPPLSGSQHRHPGCWDMGQTFCATALGGGIGAAGGQAQIARPRFV